MRKKFLIYLILTNLTSLIIGISFGDIFYNMKDNIGWADALNSYRNDAINNNPEAEYYVGIYTLEGKGIERNDKEAFEWISKSAKAGYLQAQLKLAWMHENGIGVQKDEKKAISLYKEVAENAEKKLQQINPS